MTPAVAALTAATTLLLVAATSRLRTPLRRSHSPAATPSRPAPAPCIGATEDWSPLADINTQPVGHDLDAPPTLMATHAELAAIGDALVYFSRRVEAALWEFMQPLDAETLGHVLAAREWADDPATGELDRVALEALLAEGREVACR